MKLSEIVLTYANSDLVLTNKELVEMLPTVAPLAQVTKATFQTRIIRDMRMVEHLLNQIHLFCWLNSS